MARRLDCRYIDFPHLHHRIRCALGRRGSGSVIAAMTAAGITF
jgi:hypothetical protein